MIFTIIMQQGMISLVYCFSLNIPAPFPIKFILGNDQNGSLDKDGHWQTSKSKGMKSGGSPVEDKNNYSQAAMIGFESFNSQPAFMGLDYNSEDQQLQRTNKKKEQRDKRKKKRQINRIGQKKNYPSIEQNQKRKGRGKKTLQGSTEKNRRGKSKTSSKQMKNTNLNRKKNNLGRGKKKWTQGKSRNWKRGMKTTGKGWRKSQKRNTILNRKGGKGAFGKVNLALLRQIQEKEKTMRCSTLN